MKNSTLLLRSLAIVILIAGAAHLVSFVSENSDNRNYEITKKEFETGLTDITGNWKVDFRSEEFIGSVYYTFRREGNYLNAYVHSYRDTSGNVENADGAKHLTVKNFDGNNGKGIYRLNHQGKWYEANCHISLIDENTLKISYTYYDYSDVEIWKRLSL